MTQNATATTKTEVKFPEALPVSKQIYCALPCYGSQMTTVFTQSLIQTLLRTPFIGKLDFITNDSLVSRARNTLAARFLDSEYDWMLFLDVDLEFQPEHIARLWLHGIKEGRKLIGGLYAMKRVIPRFVFNPAGNEKPDANGALRVQEVGTGFLLIHRSVFETMRDKMPDIAYTTDSNHAGGIRTEWDFFAVGPYKYPNGLVRYLSEDWYFCQRWRDLGGDVWADTKIQLRHMGPLVFPPAAEELHEAVKVCRAMGAANLPEEKV
jgi:hypothetical protein